MKIHPLIVSIILTLIMIALTLEIVIMWLRIFYSVNVTF